MNELQQSSNDNDHNSNSNSNANVTSIGIELTAANTRIKTIEKQRNDLISAFRKQMKLIDLLKRQKMHT